MYAIIEISGTQVKIEENEKVIVPKLEGNVGDTVHIDKVLLTGADTTVIGTPYIDAATVRATILAQDRTKKTIAGKYKRRKQYKRTWGYRKDYTVLKIDTIHIP